MRTLEKPFPDVSDGGAGRSGDHGDEGGTDGVTKINMEEESENGHDHYAAAQSGESAKQSGEERREQHRRGEFDQETAVPAADRDRRDDNLFFGTQVEDPVIDVHHLGVVPLCCVFHLILQTNLFPHPSSFIGVRAEPAHGFHQACRVPGLKVQPGTLVIDDRRHAPQVTCDHGQAHGEGFGDDQGKAFIPRRWQYKHRRILHSLQDFLVRQPL